MNTDAYSLSDSYVSVGGNYNIVPESVDTFLYNWVGSHYLIAALIILVLLITIVILSGALKSEKFSPTSTMRMQQRDGLGEGMDTGADRAKSYFSQAVQSIGGGAITVDASAKPNQPGSLGYQVLHSGDFDCNGRQTVTDDAWAWMSDVAKTENFAQPKSENDFTRILAGH
jgi:hypothetical protein